MGLDTSGVRIKMGGLTQDEIVSLKPGQELYLSTRLGGNEKFRLVAKVIVTIIGPKECEVKVAEILEKGECNLTLDGDLLVVTFNELTVLTEMQDIS